MSSDFFAHPPTPSRPVRCSRNRPHLRSAHAEDVPQARTRVRASRRPHPEEARSAVSKDEAEAGMREMSEKFKAMGEQVYVDAEKVKESNRAL